MPKIPQISRATLQRNATEGVATLALALLEGISATLPRLQVASDDEALHDFRVGVRRLRACLRAHRPVLGKKGSDLERKRLREIVNPTGPARDAEVQLQWFKLQIGDWTRSEIQGVTTILEQLQDQMTVGYREGLEAINKDFTPADQSIRKFLSQPGTVSNEPFPHFLARSIHTHGSNLERKLTEASGPVDEEKLHRARISAKRLRYLIEPLTSEIPFTQGVVSQLKDLQDLLGDIHDLQGLAGVVHRAAYGLRNDREGLMKIAGIERTEEDRLLALLREKWLDDAPGSFFRDVTELAERVALIIPQLI